MNEDTRPCECGKKMIQCDRTEGPYHAVLLTTYPPRIPREWKCFGCGAVAHAPDFVPPTIEDVNRRRWEGANK